MIAGPHSTQSGTPWNRRRDLPRLLPLWRSMLADESVAGRQRMIELLALALDAECARGRAGHWAYDKARHGRLLRALRHERTALGALTRR